MKKIIKKIWGLYHTSLSSVYGFLIELFMQISLNQYLRWQCKDCNIIKDCSRVHKLAGWCNTFNLTKKWWFSLIGIQSVLESGNKIIFTNMVNTGSMEPTLQYGDTEVFGRFNGYPKNGDILPYYDGKEHQIITHRFVSMDKKNLCTFVPDSILIYGSKNEYQEEVPLGDIIAKLDYVIKPTDPIYKKLIPQHYRQKGLIKEVMKKEYEKNNKSSRNRINRKRGD